MMIDGAQPGDAERDVLPGGQRDAVDRRRPLDAPDHERLCDGHAPQVLATLRNLALTLIHRTGSWAIAATRRTFAAHPERAFALLLPHLKCQMAAPKQLTVTSSNESVRTLL